MTITNVNQLVVPEGANRVALVIRHAASVQEGDQFTRTITEEGIERAHNFAPLYNEIVTTLTSSFGPPEFICSEMIRSQMTQWEMFHPRQMRRDALLNVTATLKSVNGGDWYKSVKERNLDDHQIIQEFVNDRSLWEGQSFGEYATNYQKVVIGGEAKFKVVTAHEVAISLSAAQFLAPEELGLEDCEAVLFFLADDKIVGAVKVTLPAPVAS